MNELEALKQEVQALKFKIDLLIKEDKYLFQRDIELTSDARIGRFPTSKLSFYGLPAVIQPFSTGETTGMTAPGGTNATNQSTFTGNNGTTAYTILDVVKHLKNLGILLK